MDSKRSDKPCSCRRLSEQETGNNSERDESKCNSRDESGWTLDERPDPLGVPREQEISLERKAIDGCSSLR